jgi:hypothetical protein
VYRIAVVVLQESDVAFGVAATARNYFGVEGSADSATLVAGSVVIGIAYEQMPELAGLRIEMSEYGFVAEPVADIMQKPVVPEFETRHTQAEEAETSEQIRLDVLQNCCV